MEKKNAIDFLLYSYFGVTTESEWKKCVEAAIMKAYNDATMQGAYNALISKDDDKLHEASKKAKNEAARHLYDKINELFNTENKDFDDWHSTLCGEIKNKYSDLNSENTLFTYGNAQKWVNMTIKYICILDLLNKKHGYQDKIKNYMDDFHVPVDSYIIDAVKAEPRDYKRYGEYVLGLTSNVTSWSKWDKPDEYKSYQKNIRKEVQQKFNKSPIEWESKAWIEQAEKRKQSDKQAKWDSFFKEKNSQE